MRRLLIFLLLSGAGLLTVRAALRTTDALASADFGAVRGGSLPATPFAFAGLDLSHRRRVLFDTVSAGLLLVYEPTCDICNVNMNAWLDLMAESQRRGVPVFLVGVADSARAFDYWGHIASLATIVQADTASLVAGLGATGTPTTLLVSRGVRLQMHMGPLSRGRLAALTSGMDSLAAAR